MKYMDLTIEELHSLLVKKEVTSEELTLEAIERIKANENNIMEANCFDEALKSAKEIKDVKEDEYFKGIPYLLKDNFSTKGIETTASSDILNGYVPVFDAEVVSRLKNAGAVLLGKTTLDELAMGGTGSTGHKGITTNPYDKTRMIGGSSCGSAAAVAAGVVPFALGSDTGDSVRKPAAYGGLVGFKPSWGRISRFGLFSFATSLDTVGFFTRSVYDSSKLLTLLAGHDTKDMSSSKLTVEDYSNYRSKKKARLGYFSQLVEDIKDETIKKEFYSLLNKLKNNGYEVIDYSFPNELLNAIYPTYMVISCSEATSNNANLDGIRFGPGVENANDYEDYVHKARTKGFSDMIKRRFVIGSFSLLAENQDELFHRAQKARRAIVNELNKFFTVADGLLLPAAPTLPPLVSSISTGWSHEPDYLENHLALANFSGCPSLTLPLGKEKGLPFAVNITTPIFTEKKLLGIAQDIEDLTGLKGLVKGGC